VQNPHDGDPDKDAKDMQYLGCLVELRQQNIARLRNSGKSEQAYKLEKRLNALENAHENIAKSNGLLSRMEDLGSDSRNVLIRVALPGSMAAMLFWLGDFQVVIASVAKRHNDLRMEKYGDGGLDATIPLESSPIEHMWDIGVTFLNIETLKASLDAHAYTVVLRLACLFFSWVTLVTLVRWVLGFICGTFYRGYGKCCKGGAKSCMQRRLDKDRQKVMSDARGFFRERKFTLGRDVGEWDKVKEDGRHKLRVEKVDEIFGHQRGDTRLHDRRLGFLSTLCYLFGPYVDPAKLEKEQERGKEWQKALRRCADVVASLNLSKKVDAISAVWNFIDEEVLGLEEAQKPQRCRESKAHKQKKRRQEAAKTASSKRTDVEQPVDNEALEGEDGEEWIGEHQLTLAASKYQVNDQCLCGAVTALPL
jgi:hypothetical protein